MEGAPGKLGQCGFCYGECRRFKKEITATAADLEPGTTYCVRMSCMDATGCDGDPGPELVLDTEQVGCTPKQDCDEGMRFEIQ